MKSRYFPVLAVAALAAAGCGSSSSSSAAGPAAHSSSPSAAGPAASSSPASPSSSASGTEVFRARETGQAVTGSGPVTYHLTFTGPVSTTGTFTPPGNSATHQTALFKTAAGTMAVSAVVPGNGPAGPPPQSLGNCLYQFKVHATYVVNGAKSTGKFAGATGSGKALVVSRFYVKKLASGQCDMNRNAQPLAAGAVSTFYGSGPLALRG